MTPFGPYVPVRRLGVGAFGEVWEVRHQESGASYALKTLAPIHDPEDRVRFAREAEALGRLDHPNVVRVHAAVLDARRPYLVQEFVPGGDLAARLERGPLSIEEVIRIAIGVSAGLSAAHVAGILHRDIKPANVLLDHEGRPKLGDFGLARLGGASRLTETHAVLGTPVYMSPEQARGEPLDERSDIYALGALLFALLTRRAPFKGGGSLLAALAAVSDELPPLASELRAETPAWLDGLCSRALSKNRNERPATAEEFERCLRTESGPTSRRPLPGLRLLLISLFVGVLGLGFGFAFSTPEAGSPTPSRVPISKVSEPRPSRSVPARSEGWSGINEHLRHSRANVGAWFHEESLVSLDVDGRASMWSRKGRSWERKELFDLKQGESSSTGALGLWLRGDVWVAAVRYEPPVVWSSEREPLVPDFEAFCLDRAGDRIFLSSNEERFLLQEWTPGRGTQTLADLEPLTRRDSARKESREFLEGVAVVRQDPPRLMVWSQTRLFLWDEAQGPRLFKDRSGNPERRGLNRTFVIAPGGRRFALGTRGTQIYVGDLESEAEWTQLPVPLSYQGPAFFSSVGLTFAGEDRLYAVSELRGGGVEVLMWDLSNQEPVLTHQATDEGEVPISLSRHTAGLLAIGLRGGRIWLLGGDRLGPFTGRVERAGPPK